MLCTGSRRESCCCLYVINNKIKCVSEINNYKNLSTQASICWSPWASVSSAWPLLSWPLMLWSACWLEPLDSVSSAHWLEPLSSVPWSLHQLILLSFCWLAPSSLVGLSLCQIVGLCLCQLSLSPWAWASITRHLDGLILRQLIPLRLQILMVRARQSCSFLCLQLWDEVDREGARSWEQAARAKSRDT